MWDKVRNFERQRFLALLFVAAVAGLLTYVLLAANFTGLNRLFVGLLLLALIIVVVWQIRQGLRRRRIKAPTGPLSADERVKARAKLVRPGSGS